MANDSSQVHSGRGLASGVIFKAPLGSTLPTDADSTLDPAFRHLGYVSEDGVEQTYEIASEEVREMNGRIVAVLDTDVTDSFTVTLLQSGNPDVLKAFYGDAAVDDSNADFTVVNHTGTGRENAAWVIDLADGDSRHRIVYADARVSANEAVTFQRGEVKQYGITVTAFPSDELDGSSAREFISKPVVAAAWQSSHAYELNDQVTLSGGEVLKATVAGTSGTTEPVAPAVGSTVVDGGVTWTRLS